jgi:hypothetical protein
MGQFKTDIIIFIGLLVFASIVLLLTIGQSTFDIQLHDTYFVLDKISLTILIVGPLTFLIFLTRGLTRTFKTKATNIGLIIGLILIAVITFYGIQFQQSYLSEMMRLDEEGLPDRGQFIEDAKNRINWTWGLFGFLAIGLFLLTLRTIKIWKEGYSS